LDLGYLQKKVEAIIGVDVTTITNWERQRTFYLLQFTAALGCVLKILRPHKNVIDAYLRKKKVRFHLPYCHEILHAPPDAYLKKNKPEDRQ